MTAKFSCRESFMQ